MYAIFDESSYTIAHKRVITDDDDFLLYASYQKYFLLFYFYILKNTYKFINNTKKILLFKRIVD